MKKLGSILLSKANSSEPHLPVAPRQWENVLAQLELAVQSDPNLREMVVSSLKRMAEGYTPQYIPGTDHQESTPATPNLQSPSAMPDFPNIQAPKPTNSIGPNPITPPSAQGRQLASPTRESIHNPPANVTASYTYEDLVKMSQSGKLLTDGQPIISKEIEVECTAMNDIKLSGPMWLKKYKIKSKIPARSLLLTKSDAPVFVKNVNLYNIIKSDDSYHLIAILSSTERDRDGDRFSKNTMYDWNSTIKSKGVNIGLDHGHSWKDNIGTWKDSSVVERNGEYYLVGDGLLEEGNENAKALVSKWSNGQQIAISIAANPIGKDWFREIKEKDGSKTRLIEKAELLKADVVGSPANPSAWALNVTNQCNCGGTCLQCTLGARA